jgi:hypothetical protein
MVGVLLIAILACYAPKGLRRASSPSALARSRQKDRTSLRMGAEEEGAEARRGRSKEQGEFYL